MHKPKLLAMLPVLATGLLAACLAGPADPSQPAQQPGTMVGTVAESRIALTSLHSPSWSPDGSRLVVVALTLGSPSLMIVSPDLTDRQYLAGARVTPPAPGPAPAAASAAPGTIVEPTIVVITITPGGPEQPEGEFLSPAWSPDGQRVAVYFFPSVETRSRWGFTDGVYVIDVKSGDFDQVVAFPDRPRLRQGYGIGWSPDGNRLLYAHPETTVSACICMVNADGSGRESIKEIQELRQVSWSPDGARIAFTAGDPPTSTDLFVMDADGANLTSLTADTADEVVMGFTWSPDSKRLLYSAAARQNASLGLYVMSADSATRTLVEEGQAYYDMAWSPSGEWLVLVTDVPDAHGTMLVRRAVDF